MGLQSRADQGYPVNYNLDPAMRRKLLKGVRGKSALTLGDIRKIAKTEHVAAKSVHELFEAHGYNIKGDVTEDDGLVPIPPEVLEAQRNGVAGMEVVESDEPEEEEDVPAWMKEKAEEDFAALEQLANEERARADAERAKVAKLEREALELSEEARKATAEAREQMQKTAQLRKETRAVRDELEAARGETAIWQRRHRQVAGDLDVAQHEIARLQEAVESFDHDELTVRRLHAMIVEKRVPEDVSIDEIERTFDEACARLARKMRWPEPKAEEPKTEVVQLEQARPKPMPKRQLLTVKDIAKRYGVTGSAVSQWKPKPGFPDPAKAEGPTLFYDQAAIDEWAKARGKVPVEAKPAQPAKTDPHPTPLVAQRKLLATKEVAERYGVGRPSVSNWRREAGFPQPEQRGQVLLYDADEVDAWMKQRGRARVG